MNDKLTPDTLRAIGSEEIGAGYRVHGHQLVALADAWEAQVEVAATWISQSIHEEGCRSFYDDQTGVCINEEPDIDDPRCDCGLQEAFIVLPDALRALILAASEPPGHGGRPMTLREVMEAEDPPGDNP